MNTNGLARWDPKAFKERMFSSQIGLWLQCPLCRTIFAVVAAAIFVFGTILSFKQLDIEPLELAAEPLTVLAILVAISLLYGGFGLSLLARANGLTIRLGKSTVIGAYAYLAELLPVPGGAIVRTGALMKAGGTLKRSSALVILTALLWVALAMIAAGLTLIPQGLHLSLPFLLIGSTLSTLIFAWLWSTAGPAIAALTLVHRCAGIALVGLRLQFAFAALHTNTSFGDTMPFVLAMLVGSASSIAPSGLGISESLAALAATATSYSPSTAFLAVGIDRLLSLLSCALAVAFVQLRARWMGK